MPLRRSDLPPQLRSCRIGRHLLWTRGRYSRWTFKIIAVDGVVEKHHRVLDIETTNLIVYSQYSQRVKHIRIAHHVFYNCVSSTNKTRATPRRAVRVEASATARNEVKGWRLKTRLFDRKCLKLYTISIIFTVYEIFAKKCAWPWPWSLEWAKVERKYVDRIVIFALSVTIYEIFARAMCMTLTWHLELAKVKSIYANRKDMRDFLYDGNCNVFSNCHS